MDPVKACRDFTSALLDSAEAADLARGYNSWVRGNGFKAIVRRRGREDAKNVRVQMLAQHGLERFFVTAEGLLLPIETYEVV